MNRVKDVNRIFLYTVLLAVLGSLVSGVLGSADKSMLIPLLVSQITLVIPMTIYMIRYRIPVMELLRINKIKWLSAGGLILFSFFISPLLSLLNAISMLFATNVIDSTAGSIISNQPLFISVFAIAIIPCILEEAVYRGVFFHEYQKIDPRKGILLSALLFGLMHLNLNQFFYAFVMGIFFSLLVEATDSIVSSVLVHFMINARSVVEVHLQSKAGAGLASDAIEKIAYTKGELIDLIGANLIYTIISTALAAVIFVWITKGEGRWEHIKQICSGKYGNAKGTEGNGKERRQRKNQPLSTNYLWIGIGICVFLIIWGEFAV